jgi:hypothetical protein
MIRKTPPRTLGRLDRVFWDYCARGEFRLQGCNHCDRLFWPPTPICDTCSGQDLAWKPVRGTGTIASFCTFERAYYPEYPPPHDAILVRLDEGPLFLSNPLGFTWRDIDKDMKVKVTFIDAEDQAGSYKLPVFERP